MATEEQYQAGFAECLAAADFNPASPERFGLFAHMWENKEGILQLPANNAIHRQEVASVLAAMSGNAQAEYNDAGYLPKARADDKEQQFGNRSQRGDPQHGIIAIATCPVTYQDANLPLFATGHLHNHQTGLLMAPREIVLTAPKDAYTGYWEDTIPPAHRQLVKPGELLVQFESWDDAMADIVASQLPANTTGHPTAFALDPRSPETLAKARAAYVNMMQRFNTLRTDEPDAYNALLAKPLSYPEVDINAKLEHALGIVVNPNVPRHGGTRYKQPIIDAAPDWRGLLMQNRSLAALLQRACMEQEMLEETLKAQGIERHPPVVIYQPGAPAPMVCFPPTQANKDLIAEALAQGRGGAGSSSPGR